MDIVTRVNDTPARDRDLAMAFRHCSRVSAPGGVLRNSVSTSTKLRRCFNQMRQNKRVEP